MVIKATDITGATCPECGKGELLLVKIPRWKTLWEGVTVTVEDAQYSVCSYCKTKIYDAHLIGRLRDAKIKAIEENHIIIRSCDLARDIAGEIIGDIPEDD